MDAHSFRHGPIVVLLMNLNDDGSLGAVKEIFEDFYTANKWLDSEKYYFVRKDGFRDIFAHESTKNGYALVSWAVKLIITQE